MKIKIAFLTVILFFILAAAQWFFTGSIIAGNKKIIEDGKAYRFQTEPIDPLNPFTGRYIYLNFKAREYLLKTIAAKQDQKGAGETSFIDGKEMFVLIQNNKDGDATISGIGTTEPPDNKEYIKATCNYVSKDSSNNTVVNTDYPFDKFYMDEYKAPKAETVYREANRDSSSKCYAFVKIYRGDAVVENVFIDDKPIALFIK